MKGAAHFFLACAVLAVGRAAHAEETTRSFPEPVGNPGTWVTPEDYPKAELSAGVTGIVSFTLAVSHEGRVTKCEVTESSGSTVLDAAACAKLSERGRFLPAEDEDGHPVASSWSNRVAWTIPGEMPVPPPSYLVVAYTVELDGTVTDCKVERAEGEAIGSNDTFCQRLTKFRPILDEHGEPVRKRIRNMLRVVHEPLP